jgi:hypothetical protein
MFSYIEYVYENAVVCWKLISTRIGRLLAWPTASCFYFEESGNAVSLTRSRGLSHSVISAPQPTNDDLSKTSETFLILHGDDVTRPWRAWLTWHAWVASVPADLAAPWLSMGGPKLTACLPNSALPRPRLSWLPYSKASRARKQEIRYLPYMIH